MVSLCGVGCVLFVCGGASFLVSDNQARERMRIASHRDRERQRVPTPTHIEKKQGKETHNKKRTQRRMVHSPHLTSSSPLVSDCPRLLWCSPRVGCSSDRVGGELSWVAPSPFDHECRPCISTAPMEERSMPRVYTERGGTSVGGTRWSKRQRRQFQCRAANQFHTHTSRSDQGEWTAASTTIGESTATYSGRIS